MHKSKIIDYSISNSDFMLIKNNYNKQEFNLANVDLKKLKDNLLESIYLNDELSTFDIPVLRNICKKNVPHVLPEGKPFNIEYKQQNISDNIVNLLLKRSIRRGSKKLILPFIDLIRDKIQFLVDHNQPISFVLPSLPFKDQSPFGTAAKIDHVDLGEYCFFAQIKRIIDAIKNIYSPGAHLTILCDGLIYADIFVNKNIDGVGKYKSRCEHIKNTYKLYNEVTLLDMREILFSFPNWEKVNCTLRDEVYKLYRNDELVKSRLDFLSRRFVFYTEILGYSYESARTMYKNSVPFEIRNCC